MLLDEQSSFSCHDAGHYALTANEQAAAVMQFRLAAAAGVGPLAAVNAALAELSVGDAAACSRAVDELRRHDNLHTLSVSAALPQHER